jgi:hypothetical protein
MPNVELAPTVDLEELQHLLTAAEPGAVLAPPRILRRVIKQDRRLTGIGLQVPHRKSYVITREALFQIATREELELGPNRGLPRHVLLITRPDVERLAAATRDETLIKYWRLLFHARIHAVLEQQLADHQLTQGVVRKRIQSIGQAQFDEIRSVLQQENFLLPPRDDAGIYVEFCALYLELSYFASPLVPRYFPTLRGREDIRTILTADVPAARLFEATRLTGAPDPVQRSEESAPPVPVEPPAPPALPTEGARVQYRALCAAAEKVAARGNLVRAAILRQRAAGAARDQLAAAARAAARADLERLAERLQVALELTEAQTAAWRQALPALLEPAAQGIWPVEARLLYDLQKACIDHEREIYDLDLVDWVVSLGRRPIKRLLPNHRAVLMAKHCRSAADRLSAARVTDAQRKQLAALLQQSVVQSEARLRQRLRPRIDAALEQVGLEAGNVPERVARHKLVEELLDLTVERGYLTIGDLRDALSRNNLKLPDLRGVREFVQGDPLIRTDRRLADALDGVYRRGEIYLRWLQRFSSLLFGTGAGRLVTRFLILPFGIAYVGIEGTLHLVHMVQKWSGRHEGQLLHLNYEQTLAVVGLVGALLFGLFHAPAFRLLVLRGLDEAAKLLGRVFIHWPAAVLRLPWVRRILDSKIFIGLREFVFKPLAVSAVLSLVFPLYGVPAHAALISAGVLFVVSSVVLNSRWGRTMQEGVTDAMMRTWLRFRLDIFPALFAFTMALFKELVELVERALYTVDEWLRFRTGEGRLSLVLKTVLGVFWFFVTYLVRIWMNLFFEPTVNPIKHFPVVTVSHKIMLPLLKEIWPYLSAPFMPLGPVLGPTVAGVNLLFIPGFFGFLVWEFKANWFLYEANRSQTLRPVGFGHHGETLARYLKPGFHSGTVPKLYAKLRRAERRAQGSGNWKTSRKYRQALHHIEERIRHFFEREFLTLLNGSQGLAKRKITAGQIAISSNRITLELRSISEPASALVAFEERSGWLVAGVLDPGWIGHLSEREGAAFLIALTGLYKLSGVELIREQIEAQFPADTMTFDILEEGLVVWPSTGYDVQALYFLRDGRQVEARPLLGTFPIALPTLDTEQLLFSQRSIPWSQWVKAWEADRVGQALPAELLAGLTLLPAR